MNGKFVLITVGFMVSLVVASCGNDQGNLPTEVVENSYNQLLQGNYDAFLANRAYMDSIPESFKQQLIANYKMFMHQQQEQHQGIVSFKATRVEEDSTLALTNVYVMVNYADSTSEEIVVPVIQQNGIWKLR